ncbi:MAG TPA: glycosyltransferase family 87 protein [Polyangiales bacterium]|nr:glycosyltransferase family 87 protein [Polyangiales bacterium]
MSLTPVQRGLGAGACLGALAALAIYLARGVSLAPLDAAHGLHEGWSSPPLSAALSAGFRLLPAQPARAGWAALQALACLGLTALCARELRSWRRPARWLVAGALVASALPIWHGLKWGEPSVPIAVLSLYALTRHEPWLLGMAAGLKLYPACYGVLYAMRREPRPFAIFALATLALGVVVPALALGLQFNALAWDRVLGSIEQIRSQPVTLYQTLPALIAKWIGGWPRLVRLLLTAAACSVLIAATWLRCYQRRNQPIASLDAAGIVLCTTLLVAPAWLHYYAVLPFAQAVLLARADRWSARVWLLIASYALSTVPLCLTLLSPQFFALLSATGLLPLSAALGLIGLWTCPAREPASAALAGPEPLAVSP